MFFRGEGQAGALMRYFKTFIRPPGGGVPSDSLVGVNPSGASSRSTSCSGRRERVCLLGREEIEPESMDYRAPLLMEFYAARKSLIVAARTDQGFCCSIWNPAAPGIPPFTGSIIWETSAHESTKPSSACNTPSTDIRSDAAGWGRAWLRQGLTRTLSKKHSGSYPIQTASESGVYTVRDYSEGLEGMYWRNFLGLPSCGCWASACNRCLPAAVREELGGGIVLVQPYENAALRWGKRACAWSTPSSPTSGLNASPITSAISSPPASPQFTPPAP